jgi:hypothetical protein
MATVDVHPSAGVSGPVGASLKFWERRASGAAAGSASAYALNSHISEPHRCAHNTGWRQAQYHWKCTQRKVY